jgi:MFS family permease
MESIVHRTFSSLSVRNFRLFVFGQAISLCGTWMQTIAVSWLVLSLTHSGTQLGLVVAAQFVPVLLLGAWGGVVADRFPKRRILYCTQTAAGLLALLLGLLVVTHSVHLWAIYTLAICLGLVQVVDNPTRQSFVAEMVGSENVKNAVTLNSTMVNAARVIGPSIAGVLIATVGVGPCFLANAFSYVAVLIALVAMRKNELRPAPSAKRERGQVTAGLRYVWNEPKLKVTLIMMFIIGTFAYEFPVVFPLFATYTLHGNAGTYASMMVATGVGAVIGGVYTASHAAARETQLAWTALLFGISIILASAMPNFVSVIVVLVGVGAMSVLFIALGNTTLQLSSDPSMRGRVMALWTVAFIGTTPIGGPIIGFISEHTNPRIGLATGGVAAIIAGCIGFYLYRNTKESQRPKEVLLTS